MEFSLHTYISELEDSESSSEYIESIRKNIVPIAENQLPILLSLKQLSYATGIPYKYHESIVKRVTNPYRVFSIKKRSGGKRYICIPDEYLLVTQKWIHKNILCSNYTLKTLSNSVTAYVPNSSHVYNAKKHLGASWILKLDISSFFEAISERQVYHVYRSLGYRALVAFCLARISTRVLDISNDFRLKKKRWAYKKDWKYNHSITAVLGHLPQGAPTSPILSNLVCRELDLQLNKIALNESLIYTRYSDDMIFSGSEKDKETTRRLLSSLSSCIGKYGFSVNRIKTKISKNGNRKIVTGLLVNGKQIRVPKIYKDEIRKELYYIKKFGLKSHCNKINKLNHLSYVLRLKGRIQYVYSVEQLNGKKLMREFSLVFPQFNEIESALR